MVKRIFCRHREWAPIALLWTELPDDSLSASWAAIECVRCRKVRKSNMLKPREAIILILEGLDEGITH